MSQLYIQRGDSDGNLSLNNLRNQKHKGICSKTGISETKMIHKNDNKMALTLKEQMVLTKEDVTEKHMRSDKKVILRLKKDKLKVLGKIYSQDYTATKKMMRLI